MLFSTLSRQISFASFLCLSFPQRKEVPENFRNFRGQSKKTVRNTIKLNIPFPFPCGESIRQLTEIGAMPLSAFG